jgi:hypothetical protein
MTEEDVASVAERVVKRTQPVWDVLHQSGIGIEARRSRLAKAATMFRSQRSQSVNMVARATIRMARDHSPSNVARQTKNIGAIVIGMTMGIVVVKEMFRFIENQLIPPDDDDDDALRIASELAEVVMGNLYFGDYFAMLVTNLIQSSGRFDPDISPVVGVTENMISGFNKMSRNWVATDPDFMEGAEGLWRLGEAAMAIHKGIPTFPLRIFRRLLFDRLLKKEKKRLRTKIKPI